MKWVCVEMMMILMMTTNSLVVQSCLTLCNPIGCSPPGSSIHGDSPGKNTGVGCHALLQGSSQPRDWTQVSCIAGRFFTIWATREAPTMIMATINREWTRHIGSFTLHNSPGTWISYFSDELQRNFLTCSRSFCKKTNSGLKLWSVIC